MGARLCWTAPENTHHTSRPIAIALLSSSSEANYLLLKSLVCERGEPKAIVTDSGQEFMAQKVAAHLARLGVPHLRTSPYHPQTNGKVERMHQDLSRALRAFAVPVRQHRRDEYLPDAFLALRTKESADRRPSYILNFAIQLRLRPLQAGATASQVFHQLPSDTELYRVRQDREQHVSRLDKHRQVSAKEAFNRVQAVAAKAELLRLRHRPFPPGSLAFKTLEDTLQDAIGQISSNRQNLIEIKRRAAERE